MGVNVVRGRTADALRSGFHQNTTPASVPGLLLLRALAVLAAVEQRYGVLLRKIIGFLFSGATGFVVDVGAFLILTLALKVSPLTARPLALFCAVATTFLLNRTLTFIRHDRRSVPVTFLRYVIASMFGASINLSTFTVLTITLPALPHLIAFAAGVASGLVINFLLYDRVVFLLRRA